MLQINFSRISTKGNMFFYHTNEDRLLEQWSGDGLNLMSSAAIMQSICARFPNLSTINRHVIYNVLSELTSNISDHAYSDSFESEHWWQISLFECTADSIRVEVADKGLTIPKSISKKMSETGYLAVANVNQSELIRYAITSEYCSTEKGRGKGLTSLIRLIDSRHVQHVSINSGLGSLSCSAAGTLLVDRGAILKGTAVSVVINISEELQ